MNGAPGQIQTTPLLTLNEGHGEEEDDEQEGYAPRPMDGTLGVSGARAEQFGQDAMALPPNVIHLRLLVGVGGVCCVVVCSVVRHCYCYCSCFCFLLLSILYMYAGPTRRSRPVVSVQYSGQAVQAVAVFIALVPLRTMVFFVEKPFRWQGRPARHSSSFFANRRALCRYRVLASFYHSNCTKDG